MNYHPIYQENRHIKSKELHKLTYLPGYYCIKIIIDQERSDSNRHGIIEWF